RGAGWLRGNGGVPAVGMGAACRATGPASAGGEGIVRTILSHNISRRSFCGAAAAAPFVSGLARLRAAERKRYKIRDVQVMMLSGPRTYSLVKVVSDEGTYGIAEAYGSPATGVKEQILSLKPTLIGKDPLEIERIH